MIFTVGGIKGGSGKSTVATNLVVYLSSLGKDVLLVDADDQETATDFTAWRNHYKEDDAGYTAIQLSGSAVRTQLLKLKDKYDYIVVDTGGRDTTSQRAAMTVSDFYLVPFVPRSFDIWTLEKVDKLIEEIKTVNLELQAYAFLNRADPRGSDNGDAQELLKENENLNFLDAPLGSRKVFANAASQGLGVMEYRPKDKKAVTEMTGLFKKLLKIKVSA